MQLFIIIHTTENLNLPKWDHTYLDIRFNLFSIHMFIADIKSP